MRHSPTILFRLSVMLCLALQSLTGFAGNNNDVQLKDIVNIPWQRLPNANQVLAGVQIQDFTDSIAQYTVYYNGSNSKIRTAPQLFYLAKDSVALFDVKKTKEESYGSWLVLQLSDGKAKSVHITFLAADTLLIDQNKHVRYREEARRQLERDCEDFDFTQFNNFVNSAHYEHNTRTIANDYAGTLYQRLSSIPDGILRRTEKLRISGPLNGLDLLALGELLRDEERGSNIHSLDLSRAWIISDTIGYYLSTIEMNHERFNQLVGIRDTITSDLFLDEEDGYGRVCTVQDYVGKYYELICDSLYGFAYHTQKNILQSFAFCGLNHLRKLILPINIQTIADQAITKCPALEEIQMPKMLAHANRYAFCFLPALKKIVLHEKTEYQHIDQNRELFWECPEKIEVDFYRTFDHYVYSKKLPKELEPYKDMLQKVDQEIIPLTKELNSKLHELQREWEPDSIRIRKNQIERLKLDISLLITESCIEDGFSPIPSIMLRKHGHLLDYSTLLWTMTIMDNRNLQSENCWGIWQELMNYTEPTYMHDWNEWADTSRMVKVYTTKAGTLSQQLSDSAWTEVRRLYVSGPINKEDIHWLNTHMCSGRENKSATPIFALDLSDTDLSYLPDSAFWRNFSLKFIKLPNRLRTIGKNAFSGSQIEEVIMPESLFRIRDCAFDFCYSLRKVNIPDNVTSIGAKAFFGCNNLLEVHLPDRLQTIDYLAFSRCRQLKSLEIPASTSGIGMNLVLDCPNVQISIHPNNMHYISIEGQIVGRTEATRKILHQYRQDPNATWKNGRPTF